MLFVGLSGVGAGYVGIRLGHAAVDAIGAELIDSINLLSSSLETVGESLLLAKSTVRGINQGVDTVQGAAANLSRSIEDTQPMLDQIGSLVSEDLPDSVDSMQQAFPGMTQVAGVIDETLTTLNEFRIDERILGLEIKYDLGIEYDPAMPFDESVSQVGRSLDGLPDKLRGLNAQVRITGDNLASVSRDLEKIVADLEQISGDIEATDPLLDEYSRLVTNLTDRSRLVRAQLSDQLDDAKRVVTLLMGWLVASQMAPIYLGWELAKGRRPR
jgi:ABC-type transporter Mla subunit MlaD